jgi:hypothetical protein
MTHQVANVLKALITSKKVITCFWRENIVYRGASSSHRVEIEFELEAEVSSLPATQPPCHSVAVVDECSTGTIVAT